MAETADSLMELLQMEPEEKGIVLQLLEEGDSRWMRDSKVNLQSSLSSQHLGEQETALIALAIASNAAHDRLIQYFRALSVEKGATAEGIAESIACASLLSANNVLYRFRHFVDKEKYNNLPAKVKMNIMMKPVLGKEMFELISLAVSAVNGCEMCVKSHEESVKAHGGTEERIWDAIRLASIVESITKIV